MKMSATIEILNNRYVKKDDDVKEFLELLKSLEGLADKKRHLWKQIYENALNDRESAGTLFTELYVASSASSTSAAEHITIGPMMVKYLERMSKSNEQILKLAELISREEVKSNKIDNEDLFSQISDD